MFDKAVIECLKETTQVGSIYSQNRKNQPAWKDLHRFEDAQDSS
jgi:hypothetical protein